VVDDETNPGYWTYDYTWSASGKDLSHIDVEVSTGFVFTGGFFSYEGITKTSDGPFSSSDLISWQTSKLIQGLEGPQTLNEIFGTIYGIKWELGEEATTFQLTIVSLRTPMWGDVYAKDGDGGNVYAKNKEFGNDTTDPIGNGNNGGGALVPDTTVIPIPGAAWLLGSGLIGLVFVRRRKLCSRHNFS
jgi:hypothetical protein